MFRESAQVVIDLAKEYAAGSASTELALGPLLAAVAERADALQMVGECLAIPLADLRKRFPTKLSKSPFSGRLPLADPTRKLLAIAKYLCEQVPDRSQPGLVDLRHLAGAVAASPDACKELGTPPAELDRVVTILAEWYDPGLTTPGLDQLTERLRDLRTKLLSRICGQDHAVHTFIDGLFSAEVLAQADKERRAPRAVFVFAGPPGVGKTLLAELGAANLDQPFKRFDMSAYADNLQADGLIGYPKTYHGAQPGVLTDFVEKNPNAILLFDEIEKSHLNVIHYFLQILDAGQLEDKHTQKTVKFRDTIIIFTTNAGRRLYERPNETGVLKANDAFHRRTILDALAAETHPTTGQPLFPAAICSRLATGHAILFNHHRVTDLDRIVKSELARVSKLLETQYRKQVSLDDRVSMCLVLREGPRSDARTVRAQAEQFVKTQMFAFCRLFKSDHLAAALSHVDRITFGLELTGTGMDPEMKALLEPPEVVRVLFVGSADLAEFYIESVKSVEWFSAQSTAEALEILAHQEVDLVVLDLWMGRESSSIGASRCFDHLPSTSRALDLGQEALKKIHDRLPGLPVYLLSFIPATAHERGRVIDEELMVACVFGGGARGMIETRFHGQEQPGWEGARDDLARQLVELGQKARTEAKVERLADERKILSFEAVPRLNAADRELCMVLRNFRLVRALAAADVGEVLDDVERPRTRLSDVVGARAAKEELAFCVDYLKDPRRFAALGLKPPRGVLLHGPPGTGKTMLARAVAGESSVAFLQASASSFITKWQGSGPENIRNLFARARRYAPSILFIDEIDAIGKTRTGEVTSQASEATLNALLTEMDGFGTLPPGRPIFVMAATNFGVDGQEGRSETQSRALDPALVRRFSRAILVDLPDREAREAYFRTRLEGRADTTISEKMIQLISEWSSGMSIANLDMVLEAASRHSINTKGGLTDAHLESAFETLRFGEVRKANRQAVLRTARHEAGHTVLYWLSGRWPLYVTVVSRGSHGGYMAPAREDSDASAAWTRDDLLSEIRVSLGGRAAELMFYGEGAGMSAGASSDLERASSIALSMVARFGMDPGFGVLAAHVASSQVGAFGNSQIVDLARQILSTEMDNAVKLLATNRPHIEALVAQLVYRERLTRDELKEILPPAEEPRASDIRVLTT